MAEQAAQLSVQLAKGEDINVENTISDGEYDIPYVATEPVAVSMDNIDEVIIDSGFHSKEDVYMNVSNENE